MNVCRRMVWCPSSAVCGKPRRGNVLADRTLEANVCREQTVFDVRLPTGCSGQYVVGTFLRTQWLEHSIILAGEHAGMYHCHELACVV